MSWLSEFFCEGLKRSLPSMLPWDIPWDDTSHLIFFSALYGALSVIGLGLLAAILLTRRQLRQGEQNGHH